MLNMINPLESSGIRHIHMIGIDGISMSGLAEILLNLGYSVSGSDIKISNKTKKLEARGVTVYPFHNERNILNADLVVYTAAIRENNPELTEAKKLSIPIIDRATLLGHIMKRYPFSVAISGTHGKTTTTSMVTTVMIESGLDPTVHIGAELESIGGTTKIGGGKYFVVEACEYCGSFLKFHPYLTVILNIDFDHADYFRNIEHIKETFFDFASLVPKNGYLVTCADDPNIISLLDRIFCNKVTFGLNPENAMWSAKDIEFDSLGCASYNLVKSGKILTSIKLAVPGIHNVVNSLATIASCSILGCDIPSIKQGLSKFTGAHQRFELKGIIDDIKVIDDYAHHPSEVKATLKAAGNIKHSKTWCVFQPHTYTRTKFLLDEFAASFDGADTVIVSDIYAAREQNTGEIHSGMLVDKLKAAGKKAIYLPDFETIVEYLRNNVSSGDMIITMGAGDIYKVGEMFINTKKVTAVS